MNVHNTFDPLKEIIVGDVDLSLIMLEDPRQQKRIEHIFQKTKDELNNFQAVLEARGIIVHRPVPIPNIPIQTPYWSSPEQRFRSRRETCF